MFCPRCGHDNDEEARFCANCGNRFQPRATGQPGDGEASATQIVPRPPQRTEPPAPPPAPEPAYEPPPPPARRGVKPIYAVALAVGGGALGVLLGVVLFISSDEGGSQSQPEVTGNPTVATSPDVSPGTPPPAPPTQSPVRGPGYKLTAIFTDPPNMTTPVPYDKRVFDAILAGVNWDDAAKLFGRRYPLSYIYGNSTTNLLLQRYLPEDAKRLLINAGFPNNGPKILLASNPSDSVFANWLTDQMRALGLIVVNNANQFSAEEKQQGYYGLIVDVIPA